MQAPPLTISPDEFAHLHFLHLTEHPPDSLLFPFLHGIEGSNQAQNTFFISPYSAASPPRPPRFRGLVWVVVEEDLEPEQKLSLFADRDDDDDDDIFDDDEDELDDMQQSGMDVDNVFVHEESHMHPVAHRDPTHFKEPSKVSHTFVRRASDVSETSDTNPHAPLAYQPPSTPPPCSPSCRLRRPPILTSSFRPAELIQQSPSGDWHFIPLVVPEGISLRNFGIQVPIYATLSDIVVYSPKGVTPAALELARRFKSAVDQKRGERLAKYSASTEDEPWLNYRVMVLNADEGQMRQKLPHLMVSILPADAAHTHWQDGDAHSKVKNIHGRDLRELPNTIDFARREKDEMRELTKASEIISLVPPGAHTTDPNADPRVGQLYLGNLEDVPVVPELPISPLPVSFPPPEHTESPFNSLHTNPAGYDICVECHDLAPFPSVSQLKMAEEHLATMERKWMEYCSSVGLSIETPRPPPHANAILHLPFPSSPPSTAGTMALLIPLLRFFEKWLQPVAESVSTGTEPTNGTGPSSRRWSTVSNLFPSLSNTNTPSRPAVNPYATAQPPSSLFRARSQTVPAPSLAQMPPRTRPLKVLLYSADGYTESSVPALCLLMTIRGLKLPEAYLELQVEKQRSFFVYGGDISLLKRVEARVSKSQDNHAVTNGNGNHTSNGASPADPLPQHEPSYSQARPIGRPPAKSVSFTKSTEAVPIASSYPTSTVQPPAPVLPAKGRPRANTSPWLPSFRDHLSWFNDSRFDGSFPSRVLPFLYLGNLNHASNVYMLHALGITHVVSVGECALVPPPQTHNQCPLPGEGRSHVQLIQGKEGSLWIEEREGRIKVLDIKGVCDDGIDTLEPQLEPICDWIDKAREEGGKVLVHCRVGVSRSATVTIAYVMKHLQIPLSDAYLIVRSRRLSVLIQPNMRLLYNLLGWEIRLAKERAAADEQRLKYELSGALTWPYLAKEVHALNEKYLH